MLSVYRFFVYLIQALLPLANVWIKKGKTKQFIEAQLISIPSEPLPKQGRRYWFHCASLGEFEQARPLMEAIKGKDSKNSIVVTFFSPSGYVQRQNYALADVVMYMPLDGPKHAKKLLNYLQADAAIFVKYEIWYFYLTALFKQGIPVFLVSAVFREKQFLFSYFGQFLFQLLPQYSGIFVQDLNSLELLKAKGLNNVVLAGDTRYDRVRQIAQQALDSEKIETFKMGQQLLILGSSWPEEERIFDAFYQKFSPENLKIIVAPHDVSEWHVQELYKLFADYHPQLFTDQNSTNSNIMILNSIGHLASVYKYADLAFIGGGFGKGLHNILEPLSHGVPVVFGTNTQKYPEAAMALKAGVAKQINDLNEFESALTYFLNKDRWPEHQSACKNFIQQHTGSSDLVLLAIENKLNKE